jgi:hypothetical protein
MFLVRSIQYELNKNLFNILKIFVETGIFLQLLISKISLFAKPNLFSFLRMKSSSLVLRYFQHRFTTEVYRHSSY